MAPDGSRVIFTVRLQPTEDQSDHEGEAEGSSSCGADSSSGNNTANSPCYPAAAENDTAGQTSDGLSGPVANPPGVYGDAGGAVGPAAFRTSTGGPDSLDGPKGQPLPNGLPNVKVNRTKTNESLSLTFDLSPSLTLTLAPTLGLSQNPTAAPILQASAAAAGLLPMT